jgi:hypothetical protein
MMIHMQNYITNEVNRLVEQQVAAKITEFTRRQSEAAQELLSRPLQEQRMAMFLTGFANADQQASVDAENLAILARAVSVSGHSSPQ